MAVVLLALPVALARARPGPDAPGRRHRGGQRAQRGRRDRPAHPALAGGRPAARRGGGSPAPRRSADRVDALGRATALAPTVLGAGVLLGTIAGELTARPAVGIRRSAAVETRTLGVDPAARPRRAAGGLDRPARRGARPRRGLGVRRRPGPRGPVAHPAMRRRRADGVGQVLVGSSRGPWPGSFYALPLAVALLVLAVLVAVALRADRQPPAPRARQPGARHPAAPLVGGQRAHGGDGHRARHPRPGGASSWRRRCGGGACPATQPSRRSWRSRRGRRRAGHAAPRSACWPGWCSRPPSGSTTCRARCPVDSPRRGAGAMTLSTVTVDVLDPTPPYEQLRRQLADLIGSGVLSPGDRLPPVRQLAADLGLAVGTVARTYRELERAATCARAVAAAPGSPPRRPPRRHAAARPGGGRRRLPRAGAGARRPAPGCRRDGPRLASG